MPSSPGSPTGTADFGEVSQVKQLTRDMQSNTGPAQGQPPPGAPSPPAQPGVQQPQGPPQPTQPQPAQSGPPGAGGQRVDMSKVFSPEVAGHEPWRTRLNSWAKHGPALKRLNDHANGKQ